MRVIEHLVKTLRDITWRFSRGGQRQFRRVLIETTPGMQWAVQRGFNRLMRMRFEQAGIDMPYPQTVFRAGPSAQVEPAAQPT